MINEKIKKIELEKFFKKIEIEDKILNKFFLNYFKGMGFESEEDFENFFLTKFVDPILVRQKISLELL